MLTMRADFYDRPLQYADFALAIASSTVSVSPPSREGLAQAIASPARAVGVEMEPGLVGRVISEIEGQPGGLPLLQYTLTEMFSRREDKILTIEGYEATGGVLGALGGRSEELYGELNAAGQQAAREVFLRVVTVDEVGTSTRRRARQSELKSLAVDQDELDRVLARFGAFRLLSFDRDPVSRTPTVEVAHEALLEEWDRLRGWIDDRRQDLMLARRIGLAAQEWEDAGRDPSFLLRGARLEQADEWRQATDLSLSLLEIEFLDAGRQLHAVEMEKARRLRRRVISGLSATVVILTVLALFAFAQRTQARSEARSAEARRLAGAAVAAIEEDPERAVLLALEAVEIMTRRGEAPLPEAIGALQETAQATRLVDRFDGAAELSMALSGDGTWMVVDGGLDQEPLITDLASGTQIALAEPGILSSLAVSPDDRLIATGYGFRPSSREVRDGELRDAVILIDASTGSEVARLTGPTGWYRWIDFSPNGTHLVAGVVNDDPSEPDAVVVWEISSGEAALTLEQIQGELVWARYSPDGDTIEVAARGKLADEELESVPTRIESFSTSGEHLGTVELPEATGPIEPEPDGTRVALGFNDAQKVVVVDLDTEEAVEHRVLESQSIAWSPDGRLLAVSGNQGVVTVIDVDAEEEVLSLRGNDNSVFKMAFTPDGRHLVSSNIGGSTLVWDVSSDGPPELEAISVRGGPHNGFVTAFDGDQVGVFTESGDFEVHDLDTGEVTMTLTGEQVDNGLNRYPSPGMSLVGSLSVEGNATIRVIPTNEVAAELDPCTYAVAFSLDDKLALINRSLCEHTSTEASQVIEVDTGKPVLDLSQRLSDGTEASLPWVYSAAFNPEGAVAAGRFLAVSDWNVVQIWDVSAGSLAGVMVDDVLGVSSFPLHVVFDPRGRYLAVGTTSGLVRVVDFEAFAAGTALEDAVIFNQVAHTGSAPWPSITSDGILATAGFDGLVKLWDVHTGERLVEIGPGAGPVVEFASDGSYVLYSNDTKTLLRRFFLDPQRLIDLAHQLLTRELTADECRQYVLDSPSCPET